MSDPVTKTVVIDREHVKSGVVDVIVQSPIKNVAIRVIRVYLMSLVGFLGLAGIAAFAPNTAPDVSHVIYAYDFLRILANAASLAVAPAAMSLIWNVIEILNRLDQSNPGMRG